MTIRRRRPARHWRLTCFRHPRRYGVFKQVRGKPPVTRMAAVTAVSEPAATAAAAARPKPWLRVAFAVAGLELLVLFAPTVAWLYERWTMSVWHNAHGLFIPPLVAYLVYGELQRTRQRPAASSAWGFAFLVPALLLHALDAGMHTQLLSAVALVVALPGLALLLIGLERTRAIAFPLAFMLFALPIPLAFTEQIHLTLRQLVTAVTSSALPLLGVSYSRGTAGTSMPTACSARRKCAWSYPRPFTSLC